MSRTKSNLTKIRLIGGPLHGHHFKISRDGVGEGVTVQATKNYYEYGMRINGVPKYAYYRRRKRGQ